LKESLDLAVQHVLRELKHRARIPVPGSWTLVGIADIHDFLKEGEIFVCVRERQSEPIYLEGNVLVSRSPCLHPGDVQIVRAIGRPPPGSPFEKEELPNTIVFSCQGERSLPSCLGGGDLDGDLYNVVTLPNLHPPRTHTPGEYKPVQRVELNRPCTIIDIADFVVDYINSDVLGLIASQHLMLADTRPQGVCDPDCLKLAELHSQAVDYPKSGRAVDVSQIPRVAHKLRPDWSAPEIISSRDRYYQSERAIGYLYRKIELRGDKVLLRRARKQRKAYESLQQVIDGLSTERHAVPPAKDNQVTRRLRRLLSDKYEIDVQFWPNEVTQRIVDTFHSFADELHFICVNNTITHQEQLTEEEVLVGEIMARTSQPRRRRETAMTMRSQATELVQRVRAQLEGSDQDSAEESLVRAWVAWEVSSEMGESFGARSFGWVALGAIFDCLKDIDQDRAIH
jgi:hypothetical protein